MLTNSYSKSYIDYVNIAIPSFPRTFTPSKLIDTTSFNIAQYIHEPLFHFNSENSFSSKILKTWNIKNNKKTYCFILKNNVFFHDKSTMTADDVISSLVTCKRTKSCALSYIKSKINIEKKSQYELCVHLEKPSGIFLYTLSDSKLSIVPKKRLKNSSYEIGAGPFKIKSINSNKISLIRFDSYIGKRPLVGHIDFHVIMSLNELMMRRNIHFHEINLLNTILSEDMMLSFAKKNHFKKIEYPLLNTELFYINNERFKDYNLRKFLFHFLRKNEIIAELAQTKSFVKATGFVSIGMIGHLKSVIKNDDSVNNAYKKLKERKKIKIISFFDKEKIKKIQKEIDINLKKYPLISINIKSLNKNDFYNHLFSKNFDLALCVWTADYTHPLFYIETFESKNTYNLGKINDPVIDSMLASFNSNSKSEIEQFSQSVDEYAISKYYLIPLVYNQGEYYYPSNIKNYELSILGPSASNLSNIEEL